VDRILQEQSRIEAEEESTAEDLVRIQREFNERLAKMARLRRQKKLLLSKGNQLVAKNLANMDEVEEAGQSEEATRSSSTAVPSVVESGDGVVGFEFDWGALGPVDPLLDPSLMAGLDFDGGIPQASAGNASGA
jgi:hypothetical protein